MLRAASLGDSDCDIYLVSVQWTQACLELVEALVDIVCCLGVPKSRRSVPQWCPSWVSSFLCYSE